MSISDPKLKFTWEGGNELPLPANHARIRRLASELVGTEQSIASEAGQYAHYLDVVDEAFSGGEQPSGTVEINALKYAQQATSHLASAAAALRCLASLTGTVHAKVEDRLARAKTAGFR